MADPKQLAGPPAAPPRPRRGREWLVLLALLLACAVWVKSCPRYHSRPSPGHGTFRYSAPP